jgi:hypothetical protein
VIWTDAELLAKQRSIAAATWVLLDRLEKDDGAKNKAAIAIGPTMCPP